jgi:class 3 adenylate cyclase
MARVIPGQHGEGINLAWQLPVGLWLGYGPQLNLYLDHHATSPTDICAMLVSAGGAQMSETRKLAAILVADVVGYSRLAGADEDRTLSRRSDLIDPAIAAHHGRIVKRTGDGSLIDFRSVVDAVGCAIEVQNGLVERNAGLTPERRTELRVGIHLGDVVEEADGDLMGDGANIASRLEGVAKPGAICLSEQAYWQVKGRLDLAVHDLGPIELKNIAEPIRVYSLDVGVPAEIKPAPPPSPQKPSGRLALPDKPSIAVWYLRVAVGGLSSLWQSRFSQFEFHLQRCPPSPT